MHAARYTVIGLVLVGLSLGAVGACKGDAERAAPLASDVGAGTGGTGGSAAAGGAGGSSGKVGTGGGPVANPKTFCELAAPVEPGLVAPPGFCIRKFATVDVARVLRFAPNGDVFVAAPKSFTPGGASDGPGAIVVLPDDDHDGIADASVTYAGESTTGEPVGCESHEINESDLFCVHGLAFSGGFLYYTRSDELRRFPYAPGDRKPPSAAGELVATLGAKGMADARWTHTIDSGKDGTLYVSRGRHESSDCSPESMAKGAVLSVNAGPGVALPTSAQVVSMGFRNPMYVRCSPYSDHCFANELSGDGWMGIGGREKLVVLKKGDNWAYPCCVARGMPSSSGTAEVCANISSELASIPLHDTPFGLDFETGRFPAPYTKTAFFGLHGSFGAWTGTAVSYMKIDPATGLPMGELTPFITGWASTPGGVVGRAADLAFAPDGRLFVTDDASGGIWWVAPVDLALPEGWKH
jgi:glucose/arabinose dehydrogenase